MRKTWLGIIFGWVSCPRAAEYYFIVRDLNNIGDRFDVIQQQLTRLRRLRRQSRQAGRP